MFFGRNWLLVPVFTSVKTVQLKWEYMTGRFRLRVFDFQRGCRELTKWKGPSLVKPEIPSRVGDLPYQLCADASLCKINVDIGWFHDDVIKWKNFPRYWSFVQGIHQSPVNSPHKGQWRGALMFSLICAWINGWVNNREAGDLRRHRTHYDVIVVLMPKRVDQQYGKNIVRHTAHTIVSWPNPKQWLMNGYRWHFYVLSRITLILFLLYHPSTNTSNNCCCNYFTCFLCLFSIPHETHTHSLLGSIVIISSCAL